MASHQQQQRPIPRMPSASEIISSGSFASPLAQIKQTLPSSSFASSSKTVSTVPPLDFNLFRTSSVLSIDSLNSLSTFSQEDEPPRPDSPTTPRARPDQAVHGYFDLGAPVASPIKSQGVPTPKRSFVVSSRQPLSPTSPQSVETQFHLRPVPGRTQPQAEVLARDSSVPSLPTATQPHADWTSVHGEQGSDWGEDEAQFDWLDTENAPEAVNGASNGRVGMSPSKRLSRLKAAVKPTLSVGGGDGRKLRKQLVFPRRAPPPPSSGETTPSQTRSPTIIESAKPMSRPVMLHPRPTQPIFAPNSPSRHHLAQPPQRPALASRWTDGPSSRTPSPIRSLRTPTMIPLKGDDLHSSKPRNLARNSQMSFQSVAYSFYDLEGDNPSTPTSPAPAALEIAFPHGKYMKVSVSTLEREKENRERSMSDPTFRREAFSPGLGNKGRTEEELVYAGIEARGKGELPKAAWYFMKAAEGGSATGRMYWGKSPPVSLTSLKWGVARDDRRAFAELQRACEDSLVEEGLGFHQSPGAVKLTSQQKKSITRDVSLGMFEIANCFLEGVGVKRSPDVALAYLRLAGNTGDLASQEQMGFLLSKGANGIKKDMKEAAKWYRMAIGQGSTNTFGLAWVWKDKYMERRDDDELHG